MKIAGSRVLVTGAGGFIGSHLVETLLRQGAKVRAMVRYNSLGSRGWLEKVTNGNLEIVAGDVRDPRSVQAAVADQELVFHLAALIGIPYSYQAADSYVETNVRGTLNLLQAAKEVGVRKFVHTSTSETYGSALAVPIDEQHPLQTQSPYSATKAAADHLAYSFYCSFQTPVTTVRPFNCFGPRQSARAIIPTIISQIASQANAEVAELQLGALSPTRDFTFVEDTVAGFIAAAVSEAAIGETINIGSGYEISIGHLVELIAKLMQQKVRTHASAERVRPEGSEVNRLLADRTKARKLLEWGPRSPGIEGLEYGLQQTIDWFLDPDNASLYRPEQYAV